MGYRKTLQTRIATASLTLYDAPAGRIAVCYGAADTVTGLAFTQVDELIDFIKSNPL
jgi:beta-1,4-mannooligosaccharide/beta-1,4-mannosyl-N-acetylglucosamine phosphorylase